MTQHKQHKHDGKAAEAQNAAQQEQALQQDGQQAPACPAEAAPDYYDQLLRLKAEFDNYRKRVERDRPELIAWGKRDMLVSLLPVYDVMLQARCQLEKIMSGEPPEAAVRELAVGIDMIFKEFEKVFESHNVRPMDCVGQPYNPMQHEVLSVVEGGSENDGHVVAEMQKGFICGDKVLRPARVSIARQKAQAAPGTPAEGE
ncbi:MAG: nucleotide exchange factor GrpE [Elusimicrobiaceae bacterium]|nr:nucleotide exchange factor GrpE [Elusimicrobiaceae bacterium]